MRIGIDTGGTFTDFVVARDDGTIETFKLRSNPADPAAVILAGLERIGGKPEVVMDPPSRRTHCSSAKARVQH